MITLIVIPVLLVAGLAFWLMKSRPGNNKNGEGPADGPPETLSGKPARAVSEND